MSRQKLKFFPLKISWSVCLFFLVVCQPVFSTEATVNKLEKVPRGIFALYKGGKPARKAILLNPAVTGIVIRDKWSSVEAKEGKYDWRYFDGEFETASRHGKQISIIVTTGAMGLPDWLLTKNISFFKFRNENSFSPSYKKSLAIPLFWDKQALAYKKRLIAAMGKRYTDHPQLKLVAAQCGNALTGDWNVPKSKSNIKQWLRLGYRSEKLINACKEIIDATMQAFPKQMIKMAIGPVATALGGKATAVAEAIISYANNRYPGRFIAQRNNLSAKTPDPRQRQNLGSWQMIWENQPAIAAQMLWHAADTKRCRLNGKRKPCDSASMLQQAIDIGLAYDVRYLEIYTQDIVRPYGQTIINKTARFFADQKKK